MAASSVISGEASRTHEEEQEEEENEVADLPSAGDHESSAEVDDGKLDFRSLQQQQHSHYGPEQPKTQTKVLGHSLIHLLARSHSSLNRSLVPFAHSLAPEKVIY